HRFFVAVKYVNQVHGIIEAGNFLFPQYISRYLNFALSVSPICGLVLTNIERYETIVKISQLDPLTSAYNRRYLMGKLQEEADRAARTKRPFSLVMLDIDHFKQINDRFGHQWGDTALKALVGMIKKRIRKIDTLGRWGGEEFLILLPETSGSHAVLLAEELRATLFQTEIQEVGHMTASFGVAEYREGDSVDSLVNRTDDQMYRAKQTGRNRVCCEMIE
ncbi:MAG TPA: GGDEF domain-containing protein, partial [Thermotogota bacterium]|nr:GGDEF domain-containing protein [Thermotogota bacterium]